MNWIHGVSSIVQNISGMIPRIGEPRKEGKYKELGQRARAIVPAIANGIALALKGGEGRKALSKLDKALFLVKGSKKRGAKILDAEKGVMKEGATIAESFNFESAWEHVKEKAKEYFGKGKCFTGETLVYTERGYLPIAEIQEGDLVWSMEEETGEIGLKCVEAVFCTRTHTIHEIEVEGSEVIRTTAYHPFYVACQGWVDAINLQAGDILLTADGTAEITWVKRCRCDDVIKTYNFHVEDWTSYFVTGRKVYVHNPVGEHEELFNRMHMGVGLVGLGSVSKGMDIFLDPKLLKEIGKYVAPKIKDFGGLIVKKVTKSSFIFLLIEGIMEPTYLNEGEEEALKKSQARERAELAAKDIIKLKNPTVKEMRSIVTRRGISQKEITDQGLSFIKKILDMVDNWNQTKTKSNEKESKGKEETALQQKALVARDAALADIATWSSKKRDDVTTVAAGYNRKTGKVAIGINKSSINHGLICAEDLVVAQLGGIESINDIIMTPAIRPRNMQIIKVCIRCQTKYPRSSFLPGTPFA